MSHAYDKDPYEILGIPSTATTSQVKQAYRRLARQYHPDLNKDPRAIERMKDINWANGILSDAQERSLYDLWRASGYQEAYYPGANPPSPPSNNIPYEYVRTTQRASQPLGCSAATAIIITVIVITNVMRAIQPVSQSRINYSPQSFATQTAMVQRLDSAIETLHAAKELGTTSPSIHDILYTPFPTNTVVSAIATATSDENGNENLRDKIVPDTQEWEWINRYFPELTTPNGLSNEVTSVIHDELWGYHINTRSSGEYLLLINPSTKTIIPKHIPPTETVTPSP
jgi:hypothetical protein